MRLAVLAITQKGAVLADKLARELRAEFLLPESVEAQAYENCKRYTEKLSDFVPKIFGAYDGLIFVMAVGIVVRMVAHCAENKLKDPAVVVLDEAGRHAISLLSGHEGGANKLAYRVGAATGAEPVVTTASEANKKIVVGVGCRRGATAEEIIHAVKRALHQVEMKPEDVRVIASVELKKDEAGLAGAAEQLKIPLQFFRVEEIAALDAEYARSPLVKEKIGVEGVCEPCALLAGKWANIIVPKTVIGPVTVAIAEERFLS